MDTTSHPNATPHAVAAVSVDPGCENVLLTRQVAQQNISSIIATISGAEQGETRAVVPDSGGAQLCATVLDREYHLSGLGVALASGRVPISCFS